MAYHLRRQIREAIGAALAGLPTTGARVFQSRIYPLEATDLPCLLVYALREGSEPIDMKEPRTLQRLLDVAVEAIVKATADLDDTLDQIGKEVETALAMPVAELNGIAKTITLTDVEIDMRGDQEKPLGRARMRYLVEYFAAEDAPDVAL